MDDPDGDDDSNFDSVPRKKRPHSEVTLGAEEIEQQDSSSRLLDNMQRPPSSTTPNGGGGGGGVASAPGSGGGPPRGGGSDRIPVCRSIITGKACPYGNNCKFSHDPTRFNEFKDHAYKTVMCAKWKNNGSCPYGDKCTFAHGLHELRKPNASGGPAPGPGPKPFSPNGPRDDGPYGPDSRYSRYEDNGRGGGGPPSSRRSYDGGEPDRDRRDRDHDGSRDKDRDSRDRDSVSGDKDDDYYRLKKRLDETFDKKEDALDMVDNLQEELEIVRKDRDHLRNELDIVRKERDRAIGQKEEAKKVIEGLHRTVTNSLRNFF